MKRFKLALVAIFAMIMLFALPFAVACNDASDETPDNSTQVDDKDKDNTDDQDKDKDKDSDGDDKDDNKDKDDKDDEEPEPEAKPMWVGNWKSLDGATTFSVSDDGTAVTVGTAAATNVERTDDALSFKAGDTTYSFTWYNGLVGGKIAILTEGSKTSYYIPAAAPEIGDDFSGTWYDLLDTNTLTIDAEAGTAAFNGETAVAVVDCGVVGTLENNDGSTAEINHQCLYLIMENGDIIFVGWYKDSTTAGQPNGREFNCPEVTTPETSETPLTHRPFVELYVDEDLDGTWKNVKGDITISVDAAKKTIKINGTAVDVYNNGGTRGAGNIVVMGSTVYRLEPDPGYNYYLTRETVVELGMGVRDYFLKEDHAPAKIANTNLVNTEWQDLQRTHTLKIGADGSVTFDGKAFTIFVAELLDNGIYKVTAVSEDNKIVEFSYEATMTPPMQLSYESVMLPYILKTSGGTGTETVGFLGLPVGLQYGLNGEVIEVKDTSLVIHATTFDYSDDADLELTADMLTEESEPFDNSKKHYTYTWECVTYSTRVIHIALDAKAPRTTDNYRLIICFGDNDEHLFLKVDDTQPDVTFSSPSEKAFDTLFQGTWVSESGDEIVIGEKTLNFKGTAVSNVDVRSSESDRVYGFVLDKVRYEIAWARSDYTVGYVIDVLTVGSGKHEDFLNADLPAATIADIYLGSNGENGAWTAHGNGTTYTLKISKTSILYNGKDVGKIIDGGQHDRANSELATPIGTHIYFFLSDGLVHLLIWNGAEGCDFPTVQYGSIELIFDNAPETVEPFPEALRGTWVAGDKTIVITADSFKINDAEVSARTHGEGIAFTEGGKEKMLSVNDGSNYIIKAVADTLDEKGLIISQTIEYFYKTDRPAVTVDPSLNGTWTCADADEDGNPIPGIDEIAALTIESGVIRWGDKTITVIEAGEAPSEGGYAYFVELDGDIYSLYAHNGTDGWVIALEGLHTFTKNS